METSQRAGHLARASWSSAACGPALRDSRSSGLSSDTRILGGDSGGGARCEPARPRGRRRKVRSRRGKGKAGFVHTRAGQRLLPRAALQRAVEQAGAGGAGQAVTAGAVPAGRGGSRDSAGRAEAPSHGRRAGAGGAGRTGEVAALCGTGPAPPAAPAGSTPGGTDGQTDTDRAGRVRSPSGRCGAEPPVCW